MLTDLKDLRYHYTEYHSAQVVIRGHVYLCVFLGENGWASDLIDQVMFRLQQLSKLDNIRSIDQLEDTAVYPPKPENWSDDDELYAKQVLRREKFLDDWVKELEDEVPKTFAP